MSIVLNGSTGITTPAINATNVVATGIETAAIEVNSKDVQSRLLAEYEVTGAAVTEIIFTGLDLDAHKAYEIEFEHIPNNSGTSVANIWCFINDNETQANYDSNTNGVRADDATLWTAKYGYNAAGRSRLIKCGGSMYGMSTYVRRPDSELPFCTTAFRGPASANVTKLKFKASVASLIGIGSKIRIYRGDV